MKYSYIIINIIIINNINDSIYDTIIYILLLLLINLLFIYINCQCVCYINNNIYYLISVNCFCIFILFQSMNKRKY